MNLHDSINDKVVEIDRLRAEVARLTAENEALRDMLGGTDEAINHAVSEHLRKRAP